MISKILIYVDDIEHIEDYRKVGVSTFLFALEGYCVGYKTYSLEEIEKIDVSNKYIILNRVLTSSDIDNFKKIIKDFKTIKGIVFEDIGIYQVLKDLASDLELILFQNHFATNSRSVNFWLDRVDSLFIGNELTKDELEVITKEAIKPVCLHLYGYNQVMYSRRLLLSNWSEEFDIPKKNTNVIKDKATGIKFRAIENEYGTVMYSENIFNGKDLLDLKNVKYFYVNPMLIEHNKVMYFLQTLDKTNGEDDGFLYKETIYKLKERK